MASEQCSNPWRQGYILNSENAKKYGLIHPDFPDDTIVMIVSHDCDLARDMHAEPTCEVVIGYALPSHDEMDGNCSHAKSVRKLHLSFSAGSLPLAAEFSVTNKKVIDRAILDDCSPVENVRLNSAELNTLQKWLAIRYRRPAFPNEFNKRFAAKSFAKKFEKIIKRTASNLFAIMFELDQGTEVERTNVDDTYTLAIYLVYNISEDPGKAKAIAQAIAEEIDALFKNNFLNEGKWLGLELQVCMPISADAITMHQFGSLKPWDLSHLSLSEDPQGAMPE